MKIILREISSNSQFYKKNYKNSFTNLYKKKILRIVCCRRIVIATQPFFQCWFVGLQYILFCYLACSNLKLCKIPMSFSDPCWCCQKEPKWQWRDLSRGLNYGQKWSMFFSKRPISQNSNILIMIIWLKDVCVMHILFYF